MITLYKFVPVWTLPDVSPFCVKVETYLRMTGRAYETALGNPGKAPKGKLPYIDDDGTIVADSNAILAYLEAKGGALDAGLTPAQVALATAVRTMIEEELYWVVVHFRWKEESGWELYRPAFVDLAARAGIPKLAAPLVIPMIRRGMLKTLHAQGTGRHSGAEIAAIGARILDSVSELMSEEAFFLGPQPSTLDATVYAFVVSILEAPLESPLLDHARGKAKLVSYVDRMKARYWA